VNRAQKMLAGIQKNLAGATPVTLASASYTIAQVTTALEQLVTLYTDVDDAKSAVKAKLVARSTQAPALLSLLAALTTYVKVSYSKSPDVLASFGLVPKKAATPLTTEEKMVAVAKRASTRKVRGTTGKKAKLAMKGDVTDVVVTPVTGSEPVASSAAPSAPVAASSTGGNGSATGGSTSHGA